MLQQIKRQAAQAAEALLAVARLVPGDIFVVGCSSSEVGGNQIGSHSSPEVGQAVFEGVLSVLKPNGIFLAAQCCEHLNRALVIEEAARRLYLLEAVNAIPQPKAGGSFATAAYAGLEQPVLVENVRAAAGMDIGGTLIGMHLKAVAVPVRLSLRQIGQAPLLCARTRPKFVGGVRAGYDDTLL